MKHIRRVMVIDPLGVIRAGLAALVERAAPQATIEQVGTAKEILAAARRGPWNLIVVDPALEHADGVAIVRELRAANPQARILAFSAGTELIVGLAALLEGANGFLSKGATVEEIDEALARVAAGDEYTSEALRERVRESRSPFAKRKGFAALSATERKVLRELGLGRTVKEIALSNDLGASTIGTYRARILEKLELRTTAELVRYTVEQKLH